MELEEEASYTISILNVVMDYYMSDPTPMEPTEFHLMSRSRASTKNDENTEPKGAFHYSRQATTNSMMMQVPVVRIFGPILRGDLKHNRKCKRQNGCAHIHNAFPYIICRPAFAGMDQNFFNTEQGARNTRTNDDEDDDNDVSH